MNQFGQAEDEFYVIRWTGEPPETVARWKAEGPDPEWWNPSARNWERCDWLLSELNPFSPDALVRPTTEADFKEVLYGLNPQAAREYGDAPVCAGDLRPSKEVLDRLRQRLGEE